MSVKIRKFIDQLGRDVSRQEYQKRLREAIDELELALEASVSDDKRASTVAGKPAEAKEEGGR